MSISNKSTKYYLLTGIISILPITLTYLIIIKLFKYFSNPGVKILSFIFKHNIPQYVPEILSFILTLIFIYLVGLLVSNVIGNRLYSWFERILSRIPFVNTVYTTIKQITSTLSRPERNAFKRVVFIEYPRIGIWTLSFVTGESRNKNDVLYYHIFVPTTPNPTSGYLLFIPEDETRYVDISIEDAMKIIISGGMISPDENKLNITNVAS